VTGEDLLLLVTAAYYHDVGYVEQDTDHEIIGVRIAHQTLPGFGYSPRQIRTIADIIMATEMPQSPSTILGQIMADADLDLLGRDDFWHLSQALRAELAASGLESSDEAWCSGQLAFLQEHRYFTASARALRDAGKQRNIEAMVVRLRRCRP
jgi:uncharacterized protein